jgi:hypothetical protein
MLPSDFHELSEAEISVVAGAFAGVGGLLFYLLGVEKGKPFHFWSCALHVAISIFCGVIVFAILSALGVKPLVSAGLCGLAGWMGERLLKLLELVVRMRLGVATVPVRTEETEEKKK